MTQDPVSLLLQYLRGHLEIQTSRAASRLQVLFSFSAAAAIAGLVQPIWPLWPVRTVVWVIAVLSLTLFMAFSFRWASVHRILLGVGPMPEKGRRRYRRKSPIGCLLITRPRRPSSSTGAPAGTWSPSNLVTRPRDRKPGPGQPGHVWVVELANFAALASCWHSSRTPATSSRFMTWARLASLDRVANLCTAALPDSPPRGDDQLLQVVQRWSPVAVTQECPQSRTMRWCQPSSVSLDQEAGPARPGQPRLIAASRARSLGSSRGRGIWRRRTLSRAQHHELQILSGLPAGKQREHVDRTAQREVGELCGRWSGSAVDWRRRAIPSVMQDGLAARRP